MLSQALRICNNFSYRVLCDNRGPLIRIILWGNGMLLTLLGDCFSTIVHCACHKLFHSQKKNPKKTPKKRHFFTPQKIRFWIKDLANTMKSHVLLPRVFEGCLYWVSQELLISSTVPEFMVLLMVWTRVIILWFLSFLLQWSPSWDRTLFSCEHH